MQINQTKEILRQGRVALGSIQGHLRSAEIPRMFAAAGLDWIFIDTEHGAFTPETMQDLIRSAVSCSITPVVRVVDFQYSLVARALDMGAQGIILPRVESPETLAEAVSWAKFPPQGPPGIRPHAAADRVRQGLFQRNHDARQRAHPGRVSNRIADRTRARRRAHLDAGR